MGCDPGSQVLSAVISIKKGMGDASDMMQLPQIRDGIKKLLAVCVKDAGNTSEGLMIKETVTLLHANIPGFRSDHRCSNAFEGQWMTSTSLDVI